MDHLLYEELQDIKDSLEEIKEKLGVYTEESDSDNNDEEEESDTKTEPVLEKQGKGNPFKNKVSDEEAKRIVDDEEED